MRDSDRAHSITWVPRRDRRLIGAVTILFGALPASLLAGLMYVGVAFGLVGVFGGGSKFGVLILVSSTLGIIGTYGLWMAAIKPLRARTSICLACGLAGLLGTNIALWTQTGWGDVGWLKLWLMVAPGIVALYHLGYAVWRRNAGS